MSVYQANVFSDYFRQISPHTFCLHQARGALSPAASCLQPCVNFWTEKKWHCGGPLLSELRLPLSVVPLVFRTHNLFTYNRSNIRVILSNSYVLVSHFAANITTSYILLLWQWSVSNVKHKFNLHVMFSVDYGIHPSKVQISLSF
jgi:hypothetical protein